MGTGILRILENKFNNITVNYISNFFTKKQLDELNLKNNQYFIIDSTSSIEKFLSNADVVIAGGGLIKYESAFCCIPSAVIPFDLEQQIELENFSASKLGYNLGLFESFNFKELEKKLIYFFDSSSLRKNIFHNTRDIFNSNSGQKLADSILNIL